MSSDGLLPPGVGYNDLPGNRPVDVAWDQVTSQVDDDTVWEVCEEHREGCDHSRWELEGSVPTFAGCEKGVVKATGKVCEWGDCPHMTALVERRVDDLMYG